MAHNVSPAQKAEHTDMQANERGENKIYLNTGWWKINASLSWNILGS